MNISAYREAFTNSHHSPGVRKMREILGVGRGLSDFCVPVNIGFPPPEFLQELRDEMGDRLKYYPSEPKSIREKFANFVGMPVENVVAGNGSTELFYHFLNSSGRKRRVLTCVPTFGRWTDAPRETGHFVEGYYRREANDFAIDPEEICALARLHSIDTVVISNPNNPTGHLTNRGDLLKLIQKMRSEVPSLDVIVIDESFLDFSPNKDKASLLSLVQHLDRVIVLKSLGKSFGLHSTRMGVLVAHSTIISELMEYVPYWNVNGMAEAVIDLMPNYFIPFEGSLKATVDATQLMRSSLSAVPGVTTYATDANFVYMKIPESVDPVRLRDHLLIKHGLFVRSCGNKIAASARNFRIATRPTGEVLSLVNAMKEWIHSA